MTQPDTWFVRGTDDLMDWPAVIALIGMDMLKPHLAQMGLQAFADGDSQERARGFIAAWRSLDAGGVDYVTHLQALIGSFLANHPGRHSLDRAVHQGLQPAASFGELSRWTRLLCERNDSSVSVPPLAAHKVDQLWAATRPWCEEARHVGRTLEALDEAVPASTWDEALCRGGFYGDGEEFLAAAMAQRLVVSQALEKLRQDLALILSPTEVEEILRSAPS